MTNEAYEKACQEYAERFGLGYTGKNIEKKFVLIGLVCYLTNNARKKNPDVSCLQIVHAIAKKVSMPEDLQNRIAIIAEDFMYGCHEFSSFGIKPSDIINTLIDITSDILPF